MEHGKQSRINDLLSLMEDDLEKLRKTHDENLADAESEVNSYYSKVYGLAKQIAEYNINALNDQLSCLDAYIGYYSDLVSLYDRFSGEKLSRLMTDLDEDAFSGQVSVYEKYLDTLTSKYDATLSRINEYKQLLEALDANDFQSSIHFDQRLYREDIQGSLAHSEMLAAQGVISQADKEAIQKGLTEILADIEAGKVEFSPANEDIHMNVEALLTQRIGEAGKRLHTARSRNDQVALDFRMYVRREIPVIIGQLLELERVLCRQGRQYQSAVMPGYTHLQRAQPISFAQHLMAYAQMFARDVTRLEDCGKRLNQCPLGSGALAGTTYPLDRAYSAELLALTDRPLTAWTLCLTGIM